MPFQRRCTCGHEVELDVASIGKPFTCPDCKGKYVAVWGIDPKTKKACTITLGSRPAAPRGFELPFGMFELPCPCGQSLFARPKEAGKRVQCPVCDTWLKLEHDRDPQTLGTRVRVVKSRLNALPSMPAEPPPPPEPTVQFILCNCGESYPMTSSTGNEARCPSCGTSIRLETTANAEGTCIVIDPSSAPEKRGIDEDLSLDDFQ